jgi:alkanesulfonate monooxygenase SsuD/methylene tetrahydromethanopterin reductase-like flavin-dependent oxidoreductase (luciferase family)
VPLVKLFRETAKEAGHDVAKLGLGISSQLFVADTEKEAVEQFYPSYEKLMNRVGRERGWSPLNRAQFDQLRSHGPLIVGNVQQAIDKILHQHELFGNTRFLAQLVTGDMTHAQNMRSIELYGTQVAPAVRKALEKNATK